MMYPVTVRCGNMPECQEKTAWAAENGMNILNRTWEVVNDAQHVTFNFQKEEDAVLFVLRWT